MNGSIVPIRDARAIVEKALFWNQKIRTGGIIDPSELHSQFSMEALRQKMAPILSIMDCV